jgi:hypothetical protein
MVICVNPHDINGLRAVRPFFANGERLAHSPNMLGPSSKAMRFCVIAIAFGAVIGVQSPTACLAPTTHASFASARRTGSDVRCEDALDGPGCQAGWCVDLSGCPIAEGTATPGVCEEP